MAPDAAKTWDFDSYDWVERYDERMRGLRRLCYDDTLRRLPACAAAEPQDLVVDIGTGTGNSAVPFLELGCRVVGVDPSKRMLKQAEETVPRWAGRFSIQHADDPFLRLPFGDATFDVVVSAYTIHHLDDPAKRQAVREARRVLRPGGRIVIADTMFRDAAHKARALSEDPDLEDEHQPLLTTFPAMFEAEGLDVAWHQVGELIWILAAREGAPQTGRRGARTTGGTTCQWR